MAGRGRRRRQGDDRGHAGRHRRKPSARGGCAGARVGRRCGSERGGGGRCWRRRRRRSGGPGPTKVEASQTSCCRCWRTRSGGGGPAKVEASRCWFWRSGGPGPAKVEASRCCCRRNGGGGGLGPAKVGLRVRVHCSQGGVPWTKIKKRSQEGAKVKIFGSPILPFNFLKSVSWPSSMVRGRLVVAVLLVASASPHPPSVASQSDEALEGFWGGLGTSPRGGARRLADARPGGTATSTKTISKRMHHQPWDASRATTSMTEDTAGLLRRRSRNIKEW